MLAYLHTHTDYSALDGMSRPESILRRAKELGAEAVAITDHGTVAGHIDFLHKAREVGIKPILGYEAYEWNPDYHENRRKRWHANFWARTEEGMHNLWKMASLAFADSGDGHWKQDSYESHYRECGKGVIASSACLAGALSMFARNDDEDGALWYVERQLEIFDDFYVEIHTNNEIEQHPVNMWLADFAKRHGVKMIYAIDSHYTLPEDAVTHETWLGAQTHSYFDDPKRFKMRGDYYVQPEQDIRNRLAYLGDEAVQACFDGVRTLVESVETDYPIDVHTKIPSFGAEDAGELLKQKCLDGLVERIVGGEKTGEKSYAVPKGYDASRLKPYVDRLFGEEFPTIIDNNLSDYFLIVSDYVQWAKERMLVGPARGSGGGSLVNYLLGITEIDPLRYDLPFSRFLNAGRVEGNYVLGLADGSTEKVSKSNGESISVGDSFNGSTVETMEYHPGSMPDIDCDFTEDGKYGVGDYIAERYGSDHVARIGSVMTMGIKAALKKCATYWRVPFDESNQITTLVGRLPDVALVESGDMGFEQAIESAPPEVSGPLSEYMKRYPRLFRDAIRVTGLVSSYGKHASAYVISPTPTAGDLPTRKTHDKDSEQTVTQWDGATLESIGFLKVDILGLRTLTTLEECLRLIRERRGEDIDLYKLEVDESDEVWSMLARGFTLGCFQIETSGITGVVKSMQPRNVEDLSAAIALYRPGVIGAGLLPVYLSRRAGNSKIEIPHQDLVSVLGDTCGIFLYQEQLMAACVVLADYTPVEADNIRKIIGKKQMDKLPAERERFMRRALSKGYDQQMLDGVWKQMEASGSYLFNKSHSIAYGTISLWTAWLKCHYTVEFLCACMTTCDGKVPAYIREARRLGIKVLPPNVLASGAGFTVDADDTILFGLRSVKGVGAKACEAIIEARPFSTIDEFESKVSSKCNKAHRKALARVGAFSSMYDEPVPYLVAHFDGEKRGDVSPYVSWDEEDVARAEEELLGLCVSIDRFAEPMAALGDMANVLADGASLDSAMYNSKMLAMAEVTEVRSRLTKNGKQMAFVSITLYDGTELEAVCFGKAASAAVNAAEHDIALVELKKDMYGGKTSWKIENFKKYERG